MGGDDAAGGARTLRPGDAALGRLDVLPTLDGMDDGLWALGALAARGVVVLNDPPSLLAAHDKLLTARLLRRHGLPHPATGHVRGGQTAPLFDRPVVLKPRFGSWGSEVYRCDDADALVAALAEVRDTRWYRRHGAIIQDLVPPQGYDLRVLVAAGRVVGAAFRVAAPGEWRTNIALGGVRRPVAEPPREAAALALEAARGGRNRPRRRRPAARRRGRLGRRGAERRGRVHARVRALGRRLRGDGGRSSREAARDRSERDSGRCLDEMRPIPPARCYTLARAAA